jgi:hypothetical protein
VVSVVVIITAEQQCGQGFGAAACSVFFLRQDVNIIKPKPIKAVICSQNTILQMTVIPSSPLAFERSFAACQSTQNVTLAFAPGV